MPVPGRLMEIAVHALTEGAPAGVALLQPVTHAATIRQHRTGGDAWSGGELAYALPEAWFAQAG